MDKTIERKEQLKKKKNLLVPAPACVVHHMTQQDHKYFRKKEKNHLSRGINTDVNICSFSVCFTVRAVKNICPVNCSKFHLLTGIARKAAFHTQFLPAVPSLPVPYPMWQWWNTVICFILVHWSPFCCCSILWHQVWWFGLIYSYWYNCTM